MTTTTAPTQPTSDRESRRRARVQLIRDGARVRRELSQGALHELADGLHVVVYRGERFRGPSVDAVIQAAREGVA